MILVFGCIIIRIDRRFGIMNMKTKKITWLWIFILVLVAEIFGAEVPGKISFKRIGAGQGLSQVVINAITQDGRGFMWFGTQDGLNRYDGYVFKIYRHDPSNLHSLSDSHIRYLYRDREGVLWIGTYNGGLNRFDHNSETFRRFVHRPGVPGSLSGNNVSVMYEDREGAFWVGTEEGGLNRLDRKSGEVIVYRLEPGNPDSISHDRIKTICEDREGNFWIGTYGGGLNKLDRQTGVFTHYLHEPGDPWSISDNRVMCIFESQKGDLWIGTDGGGVCRFDRKNKTFTSYLDKHSVRFINEADNNEFWFGTFGDGIFIYNRENESFNQLLHRENKADSLTGNRMLSFYKDNMGILWLGSNTGINEYNPQRLRFYHITELPGGRDKLSDKFIRAVYQDRLDITWLGTYHGGLSRIDRKNGTHKDYKHRPGDRHSLSDDRVFAITEGRDGTMWIGTLGGGLCAFNRETERFTCFRHDRLAPDSLSSDRVRTVLEDRKGRLWVGTMGGGLNLMNRKNNTFTRFRHTPDNPNSLGSDRVFPLLLDRDGILWIGTFGGGLNSLDPETGIFKRYLLRGDADKSTGTYRIFSLYEDRKGVLWVGTDGGGLNRFDRALNRWTYYTEKDGLINNVIYGILEDNQDFLWLSTNKGLSRFDPEAKIFSNYTVRDGLINQEYNSGAYYKDPMTGELFFGGIKGVDSFFPDTIMMDRKINPVSIIALRKFDRLIKPGLSTEELKKIELSYRDNFFSIDFVSPEFRYPEENRYMYRLEGYEDDWLNSGGSRRANYVNIPHGKYVFRVKSSTRDGAFSETSLKINITPPFWQTWWFRVVGILFILTIIFTANQLRTRAIRKRNRQLEEMNRQLNIQVKERQQSERLQGTLYQIAKIVHSDINFNTIYRSIHSAIGQLMDVENFYIGLYDARDDSIYFPYFVDEFDDYSGQTVQASHGLTEYVIRTGKSLLVNEETLDALEQTGEVQLVGSLMKVWLGVPLKFRDETFGAVVVQHYHDRNAYTEKDKGVLEFVSHQIAGVIVRKREEEEKATLKEKLSLSEKMEAIGRLAGGVAHDLNNVLSAIVSYPELMLMKLPEDSPFRKPLLTMKRSGQRAAAIVQDLLTLARRGVEIREVVNWNEIIKEYMKSPVFERIKLRHRKIKINVELDDDLLNIEGSPVHLTKALMNLISNAAEAMPEGGTLTITTNNLYPRGEFDASEVTDFVVLTVSDTGVGIARKDLKRIFEPFYTRKEMGISGTGLGMTIVWNTMQDHGGYINMWSKVGKGSHFELYIPATAKSPEAMGSGHVNVAALMGNGERILVVDDVLEQREIVTVLLNELGYWVESAGSGEEAVEYLKTNDVDLLLLDMIMETGMDGLDTYKKILNMKPGTKAIIASGFSETNRVRKAIKMGAATYIAKPYTLEKIGAAIKKELRKR